MGTRPKQAYEEAHEIRRAVRCQDPLKYLLARYKKMKGSAEKDVIALALLPYFHAKKRDHGWGVGVKADGDGAAGRLVIIPFADDDD